VTARPSKGQDEQKRQNQTSMGADMVQQQPLLKKGTWTIINKEEEAQYPP
jgi:hypothetical protein